MAGHVPAIFVFPCAFIAQQDAVKRKHPCSKRACLHAFVPGGRVYTPLFQAGVFMRPCYLSGAGAP